MDTPGGSTMHTTNDPQAVVSDEEHDQSNASGHNDSNEGLDNTGDEGRYKLK